MKISKLRSLLFAVICGFCAFGTAAATSLFSDYGQIQTVQNYSSNPFWTPNSPYNQRLPQPVYVQGADLNAEDCINVVQSLVSVQCMVRDNCKNTTLAEIRPAIMVQLSNLPGHNYVSACSGYLDYIFESYVAKYGNSLPNRVVDFPDATTPNPNLNENNNTIPIENPYKQDVPKWRQEINERSNELQQLQQQNSAGSKHLSATAFPAIYEDLSFAERIANATEGYAPYKDATAYEAPKLINEKEWCEGNGAGSADCKAYEAKKAAALAAAQAAAQAAAGTETGSETNSTEGNTTADSSTSANPSASDADVIAAIVTFLNPQNNNEKTFFTDLATDFVSKAAKDDNLIMDNSFVYNFLSEKDKELKKYEKALITVSGTAQSEELRIDIDWDEVKINISTLFDSLFRRRGALICENNRSYQIGLDTALWVATAAAAIASFGAGGVAAASGRAALGAGLKALAKGAAKVGLKSAAKSLSKTGGKQIVKGAVKAGLKKNMKGWALPAVQKKAARNIAKKAGQNLITKRGILLASGAVAGTIYLTGKESSSSNAVGTLYSLVESGVSTEIINCQDLDYGEGCYAVCGHDKPDDDLNTKVFKPILGHNYCVSETDYTLYDMETKKPLMMTNDQYEKVTKKIRSDVVDQGVMQDKWKSLTNQKGGRHGCDWNEDDIDMYFGSYIYDPDDMTPSKEMIIEEVIRIDD
jgi:hypothetical protein